MPHRFTGLAPFPVVMAILLSAGGSVAQPVDSFGRGVPLGLAIQRIVPEGVSVRVEPPSLEERRVSWMAGPDWRQVLRRAVQAAGLRYREEAHAVIIEAPPPPPPAPPPPSSPPPADQEGSGARGLPGDRPLRQEPGFVLSSTRRGESTAATPRETGAAPEVASRPQPAARQPAVDQGVWRARRGQTLDQVLAEWSERAGWTLVFNTPIIYEIQAGAELRGDFIDAAASLINSIQARPLPRAVFYRGNRVLVVSNSFEASSP